MHVVLESGRFLCFLSTFSREIDARQRKIEPLAHALRLTAELSHAVKPKNQNNSWFPQTLKNIILNAQSGLKYRTVVVVSVVTFFFVSVFTVIIFVDRIVITWFSTVSSFLF